MRFILSSTSPFSTSAVTEQIDHCFLYYDTVDSTLDDANIYPEANMTYPDLLCPF